MKQTTNHKHEFGLAFVALQYTRPESDFWQAPVTNSSQLITCAHRKYCREKRFGKIVSVLFWRIAIACLGYSKNVVADTVGWVMGDEALRQ
jgi:hypothetical protein